ncbi:MAG: two-component system regulatory protein YycI [bacterium]
MDWGRAKDILIVAFLALNLFLGFRLWTEMSRYPAATSQLLPEEIAATLDNLAAAGIELAVPIPREAPPLPLLQVQVSPLKPQKVAQYLLGNLEDVHIVRTPGPEGEILFIRGGEELSVYPNGIITYRYLYPRPPSPGREGIEEWAEEFIAHQREFGQELRLKEIRELPQEEAFLVRLEQLYQDRPLVGSAGVEALVAEEGIKFLWQRPLEPIGPAGEKKAIIPATEALLRLAAAREGHKGGERLTIAEITLGYYNKLYDAQEWEAVPVWALRTDEDQWYYINAFTGEQEL